MSNSQPVTHEFVDFIPVQLKKNTVYVSITYGTVAHLCFCGCGEKVVTPLRPSEWKLTFDGATVSLDPSIGNWNFACRSHYWIKQNQIMWAGNISESNVEQMVQRQQKNRAQFIRNKQEALHREQSQGFWVKIKNLFQ